MPRAFAILPAAGRSIRMGQPKLLMPLEGRPLIAHAIAAWQCAEVDRIVVVVRADDTTLAEAIKSLGAATVDLVQPDVPPPDMKASVQAALRHIGDRYAPGENDCFLVAPADMPRLSPAVIAQLLAQNIQHTGKVVIPTAFGRRGHPVLFPWPLAADVHALPAGTGLNFLVDRSPSVEMPSEILLGTDTRAFADIDTPEEYRRLGGE